MDVNASSVDQKEWWKSIRVVEVNASGVDQKEWWWSVLNVNRNIFMTVPITPLYSPCYKGKLLYKYFYHSSHSVSLSSYYVPQTHFLLFSSAVLPLPTIYSSQFIIHSSSSFMFLFVSVSFHLYVLFIH